MSFRAAKACRFPPITPTLPLQKPRTFRHVGARRVRRPPRRADPHRLVARLAAAPDQLRRAVRTSAHTSTHTCAHTCTHSSTHTSTHTTAHTCTHSSTHTSTHTSAHTSTHTPTPSTRPLIPHPHPPPRELRYWEASGEAARLSPAAAAALCWEGGAGGGGGALLYGHDVAGAHGDAQAPDARLTAAAASHGATGQLVKDCAKLLYYYTTILLYYYTTILLYYYTTILLYCYTAILLYYAITLLPMPRTGHWPSWFKMASLVLEGSAPSPSPARPPGGAGRPCAF